MIKQNSKSKKSLKQSNKTVTKDQVRQMIKGDKANMIKYVDTIVDLSSTATGTQYTTLTMPTVGSGVNNSSGTAIILDHIDIRLTDSFNDALTSSADTAVDRIVMIQTIGEAVINSSPDLFDHASTVQNTTNSPISYANNNNLFRVIMDKTITLDTFNPIVFHSSSHKCLVHKSRYNTVDSEWAAGVPVVAVIRYVPAISGSSTFKLEYIVRVWFYDV